MDFRGYRPPLTRSTVSNSYDYALGLRRLSWNLNNLDGFIHSELHDVPQPRTELFRNVSTSNFRRDSYSTSLLPFCPRFWPGPGYYAAFVNGNGCCLFNAASLLITGSEDLALELRFRTCVEMAYRRREYVNHHLGERFREISNFHESIEDCARSNPSSIWTMLALASVTERTIVSMYPYVNGPDDRYAQIANVFLRPLTSERPELIPLFLMWTRAQPNDGDVWVANHFVPILWTSGAGASIGGTPMREAGGSITGTPRRGTEESIAGAAEPARIGKSEIVSSNKGGKKLLDLIDGYMYTQKHVGVTHITWRCASQSTTKCLGTAKTDLDFSDATVTIGHHHPGNTDKIEVVKARDRMKLIASSSSDKPSQILARTTAELRDSVNVAMPSRDTCRRTLQRARAKHRPAEPATLKELVIRDRWTMTTGEDPQLFLLFDNGPEAAERVVIFSTNVKMQCLAASEKWFMDGTFGVAPLLFSQLYVIHGQVGTEQCPLLFALLQQQTPSTYEILLRFITDRVAADPSVISVDFEKAIHNAIHTVLGAHVIIQGCFYHLTQSTWRKIQKLGLTDLYRTNEEFRLFCGQLDGLALLPLAQVSAGMDHLKQNAPEAAAGLVKYFDETYVSGPLRRRPLADGVEDVHLRRASPRFPPEMWNVHAATLENDQRTNNVCEGWNNGFAHLVDQKHPSIWKLIEHLQAEEKRVHVLMLKQERGIVTKKRVRQETHELQKRLHNLCTDFTEGRRDVASFLRGVSYNIRFGQPYV